VSTVTVALAAAQDTGQQASTSCPTTAAGGLPPDGAARIAGTTAPVVIVAKTIAAIDSSSSTVISPDIADQIRCGKAVINTITDVVFSRPTLLLDGTAKKLAMDIQIPEHPGPKPLVVYMPGSGFVLAPKESAINLRTFVAEAGFVVVFSTAMVRYRRRGPWSASIAKALVCPIFGALGLVPAQRNARVVEASITWDYTTWLNIAFLILAGLLVWRFLKTGGPAMLRMMNMPAAMGQSH
jgi:hypothetical protein